MELSALELNRPYTNVRREDDYTFRSFLLRRHAPACGQARAQDPFSSTSVLERCAMNQLINDPRDSAHLRLIAQCSVFIVAAAALFYVGSFPWWVGVAYFVVWAVFAERFTMMFHCTIHRRLFKKRYWLGEAYLSWVLCPFFGQTPGSFYVHHMGMHHIEDNLPDDLSSTMRYQRDNAWHFLRYYLRFACLIPFELAAYLWRTGNTALLRRFAAGELAFYAFCIGCALWRPQATIVVFLIPFFYIRLMMMVGNWAQHAFVDPAAPDNAYRSSVNTIDRRYNARLFNCGYHIYHHVRKGSHFSELAPEFEQNREKYGREDAIVFDRIDLLGIWFLLLTRKHKALARYFVRLPGAPERTDEEVIALFKRRLAPIGRQYRENMPLPEGSA